MKNFLRNIAKDWDLWTIILLGCVIAGFAQQARAAPIPTPVCDPVSATNLFEVEQATPFVHGIIWYCNTPYGYKQGAAAFVTLSQAVARSEDVVRTYIANGWQAAWAKAYERPATAAETTFLEGEIGKRILSGEWPSAKVKLSTATDKARQVMALQSDGTLLPYKVGTATQRILQGLSCDVRKRVPGTIYFNVAGQKSMTSQTLPAQAYAECTVTPTE